MSLVVMDVLFKLGLYARKHIKPYIKEFNIGNLYLVQ